MDERKVEVVKSWPTPTAIKELQRFLGFTNLPRIPEATEEMFTLQQTFTPAPFLVHPGPDKLFMPQHLELEHSHLSSRDSLLDVIDVPS
ncbi:Retrovirus-related Pol polyprotein from transposon opus [Labeo rohita]|uniref:Retrovirus-related Pol polyprotein from transposon opus n=1 Tax=Labeo rohita TaxID=84645 RepID=A0ABQ8MWT7_LABRO|nr:Retrovirus-related Pol polyprotein from transposon opus [Labeo rohita]